MQIYTSKNQKKEMKKSFERKKNKNSPDYLVDDIQIR